MKLLVDIGNSRLKWAVLEDGAFAQRGSLAWRDAKTQRRVEESLRSLARPEGVFVANVGGRGIADHLGAVCARLWNLSPVHARVERERLGVTNAYADFTQLGVDRWLALLAAWTAQARPACIAGCGTALTLDGLDARGRHLGGWIVPGIDLMERLLIEQTDGIPGAAGGVPAAAFGRSTGECVRNGAAAAQAALIDRAADSMPTAGGDGPRLLITGGAAERVLPLLRHRFEFDPDLVFRGLALIAEHGG